MMGIFLRQMRDNKQIGVHLESLKSPFIMKVKATPETLQHPQELHQKHLGKTPSLKTQGTVVEKR